MFDAHNHLSDLRLRPFLEGILTSCADLGIMHMAVNGTHPDDWSAVASLAKQAVNYGIRVYPQFGVHPWRCQNLPADWFKQLQRKLETVPDAGIGEVGLDRWKRGIDFELQREIFRSQVQVAARRNLPLSIHCLKAWGHLQDELKRGPLPSRGFLLHGYGGDWSVASQLLPLGARFSFCGHMLHPHKEGAREAFQQIPAERLLVESDAPDMLAPKDRIQIPLRSAQGEELNSPVIIPQLLKALASLRADDPAKLNEQILCNANQQFG